MGGKAYDLVYLPDGKFFDASKAAGVDNLEKLRVRMAGNTFFINLIGETGTKDVRIKRIASLLEGVNKYVTEFCNICDDAFEICDKDPRRYRGPHYQLAALKAGMDRAADYAYEYSKRILLYLELLRTTGSTMEDGAKRTLQTSIETQKKLIYEARWSVIKQMNLDVRPPPGPGSLPYGHPEGANPEDQDFRPLLNGKPVPLLDTNLATGELTPVDWRYDPGFKVPGSQHCKFLRLPGPYFAPQYNPRDPYDRFFLPQVTKRILSYYANQYDTIKQYLEATGRIPITGDEVALARKKVTIGVLLAETSGENYDLFSVVDQFDHRVNVEKSTEPYIYCAPGTMIRRVNFGDGSGRHKPEDLNRGVKVEKSGQHHDVKTVDEGMGLIIARAMWD
uniref:MAT1-1-2 n=1 Tax=Cytospora mali TaxID=578113 RepID=A0A2Z2EWK6_CYTMA|nr:MAT1-1-2 [Valsa mali]